MMTFRELVDGFARWEGQTALIEPAGESLSYPELSDRVHQLACSLPSSKAAKPVGLVLPNSLRFVIAFLALAYRGDLIAPLNSATPPHGLKEQLGDLGAQAMIGPALGIPVWEGDSQSSPREPRPDGPVLILQTSGTTSRPKSVVLNQRQLLTSARTIASTYDLGPEDRSMLVMPLFHVHGLLAGLLAPLLSGGAVIVAGSFSASRFWDDALRYGATWTTAVPTILQILHTTGQSHNQGRGALRFLRSCSSALGPTLFRGLEERFQCPVLEAYGMTEATHQMASNPLPPAQRKAGSVGLPTGVSISIRDETGQALPSGQVGEVCLSGPTVIASYHNNAEADQACFFGQVFRTGDQGYLDDDGYLFLTGRLKELINRGGEKISPVRLDEAIAAHPKVLEVRCFGMPDTKYGEIVGAAVVCAEPISAEELGGFLRDRLPAHEIPARWFFLDALPKSATGKVSRVALARTLGEQS